MITRFKIFEEYEDDNYIEIREYIGNHLNGYSFENKVKNFQNFFEYHRIPIGYKYTGMFKIWY